MDFLPHDIVDEWKHRATELAARAAVTIRRQSEHHLLSYQVVTGDVICQQWPELFDFYIDDNTRAWVASISGDRAYNSRNLRSAININMLSSSNHAYRWHFDAVPHTLILYLTDPPEGGGGELDLIPDLKGHLPSDHASPASPETLGVEKVTIVPRAGAAVLMDGTRCYHRVAPMKCEWLRLSIPMVFPVVEDDSRPPALDDYLYSVTP